MSEPRTFEQMVAAADERFLEMVRRFQLYVDEQARNGLPSSVWGSMEAAGVRDLVAENERLRAAVALYESRWKWAG